MLLGGRAIIQMSIGKLLIDLNIALSSDCASSGFATNAGMAFKTPEEFFLAHTPVDVPEIFDPTSYIKSELESAQEGTGLKASREIHLFNQR